MTAAVASVAIHWRCSSRRAKASRSRRISWTRRSSASGNWLRMPSAMILHVSVEESRPANNLSSGDICRAVPTRSRYNLVDEFFGGLHGDVERNSFRSSSGGTE